MEQPSLMVFTHDSIGLGEDGPTHQPIEHLASLRAIPNMTVLRPGDANEVPACWKLAVENQSGPSVMVYTRQNVEIIDRSQYDAIGGPERGAYVLADAPDGEPDLIVMATGSEVPIALEACEVLWEEGIAARLVSMPSWEVFEAQDDEYQEKVLPEDVTARLAVEAASPQGWHRWVGTQGEILGIDRFGASAPWETNYEKYGFTPSNIADRARALTQR
jgi:transketolase